ncbi:hypothetical protein Lfu02_10130 [Longispora fulva]|uniref:Uncharacterized protein n=1 Tax=Longispora fulva TaxID=619741 RepID=A0A8J7KGN8_9ACTN|nr:hypothetical protein [Longispora fulva]MBG6135124.1 hypothetical protein [Longispora fulva]GIG56641.1 hypothetical protein Lfu02_10130 [Longispora fulva]
METPSRSPLLDWAGAALAAWLVGGACIDAWAHWHIPELESFFTPWHAILYSGMFVNILFVGVLFLRGRTAGGPLRAAFPPGYGLTAVGCLVFLLAGQGDMAWHTFFGIERNTEALLSPTHLGLMVGATLVAAGPWRAARLRGDGRGDHPAALSAGLVLAMLWFFLQFDLPYTAHWAAGTVRGVDRAVQLGVLGVLVATVTMVGVVLLFLRDLRPPPGLVTIVTGVPTLFVVGFSGQADPLVTDVAALTAAVLADVVLAAGPRRLFAVAFPVMVWAAYFGGLAVTEGVAWSVHVWAGCVVVAGLIGWAMSQLVPAAAPVARSVPLTDAPEPAVSD